MDDFLKTLLTIVGAVFASSGFWAYIQKKISVHDDRTKMLIGLGHVQITSLSMKYIKQGYITQEEYENLHEYLYTPYKKLGGNGSAERIMKEVDKLPIRPANI